VTINQRRTYNNQTCTQRLKTTIGLEFQCAVKSDCRAWYVYWLRAMRKLGNQSGDHDEGGQQWYQSKLGSGALSTVRVMLVLSQ